ncbi:MAG: putative LPS assembly protein LptD [Gemmatimonadales bacterium]
MRLRLAALAIAAAACIAAPAAAQVPGTFPPAGPAQAVRPDTGRARRDSAGVDTSKAGRGAGLPAKPSRSFATPDSVAEALIKLRGFRVTRYSADSVQFLPPEKQIRLTGNSLLERDNSTLQADTVGYDEHNCLLTAAGSPEMFDAQGVVVGHGMRYDACNHAGIVGKATTSFPEGSATWYLRGNMAMDNEENRTYAAGATITSCDDPDPHYHFEAHEIKFVSKNLMVARPALLYVADVPILWMPFIFQDMRHGRHSGMIPPQFGINDIVRNSPTYHRHISNFGWYWVLGDYADAQVTTDWYAQSFWDVNGRVRYRWLDRFLAGGVSYQELHEVGGATSDRFTWYHQQQFSQSSSLSAGIDYASSSRVISRNAVDPVLAVATIDSRVNYQQTFAWGSLSLGGSRTQNLDKPLVTMSLPTVAFTPNPIAIGQNVTWSPSFNLTNALQYQQSTGTYTFTAAGDSSEILANSRQTTLSFSTPFRIGRWTWSNSFSVNDQVSDAHRTLLLQDPADSTKTAVRSYAGTFETDIDWSTGIGLPVVLQGTWNLQPSVSVVNKTGGAFLVRSPYSGGAFVSQGKRLGYNLSISPTFFGLFGGIGPVARFRHSISPSISWSYSPATTIPEAYARAISTNDSVGNTHIPASQTLTFGLTQNLEAKLRPPPLPAGDTTKAASDSAGAAREGPKIKLLSIQTSGLAIDLEQAKRAGHTGWTTGTLSNTFSSDLLRDFSLSTTHDLFQGTVGTAGSKFSPYLTSVSARFSLGASFLQFLGSLFGFGAAAPAPPPTAAARRDSVRAADSIQVPAIPNYAFQRGPLQNQPAAPDRMLPRGAVGSFRASLAFDLQRTRPVPGQITPPTRSTLNGSISFSPTRDWSVSWQTLYDFTAGKFGSHVLTLNRNMHDWHATFSFVQSPNGNVVFNFNITLIDQPEIKFDYDQRNLPSTPY